MSEHLNIIVHGKVQGVNFRQETAEKARGLGLKGFVRNEPDGTVRIEAEGHATVLQKMLAWCRQGPALAQVSRCEASVGPQQDFKSFEIRR